MAVRRASAIAENRRWTVERLVAGGEGLAHLADGRVGFVPGSVPGDEVEVVRVEDHKSFARATEWRLVHASPGRVTPACPLVERCGGCDWMHVSRRAELEAKALVVSESLRRIGKLGAPRIEVVTAGPELGYRSRARFHIDDAGAVGFFGRRSHDVVDVTSCLVCHSDVESAYRRVQVCAREGLSAFSSVEIRRAPSGAPIVLSFDPRVRGALPEAAASMLRSLRQEGFGVHVVGQTPDESVWQRFPLPSGVALFASPECFTQVNLAVNERLVEYVRHGAMRRHVRTFCDLYAGVGNFSLPLLASGCDGVAVERNPWAVDAFRRASLAGGLECGEFLSGDVADVLRGLVRDGRRFDLVLLDPPRSGAPDVAPLVAALGPSDALFCGCDPAAFARDVSALARHGYELTEVRVFDMFPRTHHLEAVAWLRATASRAMPRRPTTRRDT